MDDHERWAQFLSAATDGVSHPERICRLCVDALDVTGGGISMVTAIGNRGVVCATDDVSAQIEELQFTLGEGPCVDAVSSGAPVLVSDLRALIGVRPDRWPTFVAAATSAGVRAAFAFPLRIGAIQIGALDLYRDSPGDLTDDQLSAALMAADAAGLALLNLDTASGAIFDGDLDTRSTYLIQVHQATGMVQVQLGVSTEDALLALRARAFASGRSVADVSSDVVTRRLRFTVEDE